ncbi:MAG: hypothetical protein QOK35_2543 [Pseudonocardiales bacterium]|nr:hypothetical protein [Pseudonocardiales bacterium]
MQFDSPLRGSAAVAAGALTRARLRGPGFRRLFDDVYVAAAAPVDLALRSRAAHLLVDGRGVLAGLAGGMRPSDFGTECRVDPQLSASCPRSTAEILGAPCGPDDAPAEVALPGGVLLRQPDLVVHRGLLDPDEVTSVAGIGVTTRARAAYDLGRRAPSLVEAVVAADALAPAEPSAPGGAFVPADLLRLRNRHLGARNSRRLAEVVALTDPLAASPMETRTRLALVLNGLPPPVSQFEVRGAGHRHYLDLPGPGLPPVPGRHRVRRRRAPERRTGAARPRRAAEDHRGCRPMAVITALSDRWR